MTDQTPPDDNGHWQLDKHISLSMMGALALQLAGFVWYASSINSRVNTLESFRITAESAATTANLTIERVDSRENGDREVIGNRLVHLEDVTNNVLEVVKRLEARRNLDPAQNGQHP